MVSNGVRVSLAIENQINSKFEKTLMFLLISRNWIFKKKYKDNVKKLFDCLTSIGIDKDKQNIFKSFLIDENNNIDDIIEREVKFLSINSSRRGVKGGSSVSLEKALSNGEVGSTSTRVEAPQLGGNIVHGIELDAVEGGGVEGEGFKDKVSSLLKRDGKFKEKGVDKPSTAIRNRSKGAVEGLLNDFDELLLELTLAVDKRNAVIDMRLWNKLLVLLKTVSVYNLKELIIITHNNVNDLVFNYNEIANVDKGSPVRGRKYINVSNRPLKPWNERAYQKAFDHYLERCILNIKGEILQWFIERNELLYNDINEINDVIIEFMDKMLIQVSELLFPIKESYINNYRYNLKVKSIEKSNREEFISNRNIDIKRLESIIEGMRSIEVLDRKIDKLDILKSPLLKGIDKILNSDIPLESKQVSIEQILFKYDNEFFKEHLDVADTKSKVLHDVYGKLLEIYDKFILEYTRNNYLSLKKLFNDNNGKYRNNACIILMLIYLGRESCISIAFKEMLNIILLNSIEGVNRTNLMFNLANKFIKVIKIIRPVVGKENKYVNRICSFEDLKSKYLSKFSDADLIHLGEILYDFVLKSGNLFIIDTKKTFNNTEIMVKVDPIYFNGLVKSCMTLTQLPMLVEPTAIFEDGDYMPYLDSNSNAIGLKDTKAIKGKFDQRYKTEGSKTFNNSLNYINSVKFKINNEMLSFVLDEWSKDNSEIFKGFNKPYPLINESNINSLDISMPTVSTDEVMVSSNSSSSTQPLVPASPQVKKGGEVLSEGNSLIVGDSSLVVGDSSLHSTLVEEEGCSHLGGGEKAGLELEGLVGENLGLVGFKSKGQGQSKIASPAMSEEKDHNKIKNERLKMEQHNALYYLYSNIINIACLYKNHEFYFPIFADFRGRMYPLCNYLNYQGNDLARSLLLFTSDEELNSYGEKCLNIYLSNLAGYDKIPWNQRLGKSSEVISNFKIAFNNYLDNKGEMLSKIFNELSEPFQFMSIALAIVNIEESKLSGSGNKVIVNNPILFDASCSGIQHISALTLDKGLAKNSNVISYSNNPGDEYPEDFYTYALGKINEKIKTYEWSESNLSTAALCKQIKLTRKSIKRSVMTIPYNISLTGVGEQLEEFINKVWVIKEYVYTIPEELMENNEKLIIGSKEYGKLTSIVYEVLTKELPSLKDLTNYFKNMIKLLNNLDLPITWITPAGLKIRYSQIKFESITTKNRLISSKPISISIPTQETNHIKMIRSFMPNFIHSLDAANVHILLNNIGLNYKIPVYTIHDCFATTPNNMELLEYKVKEAFIEIYFKNEGFLIKTHNNLIEQIKSVYETEIINGIEYIIINYFTQGDARALDLGSGKVHKKIDTHTVTEMKNMITQEIQTQTQNERVGYIPLPNLPDAFKNKNLNEFIKGLMNSKYFIG